MTRSLYFCKAYTFSHFFFFVGDFKRQFNKPVRHNKPKRINVRLQLNSSPCFCSDWFNPTIKGTNLPPHQAFLFLVLSIDFCFFALIYPGNICQVHTVSFINTLLHTYKVTHIHTWQLPSATTVFYCSSSEQLHQSNLEFRKLLKGISMVLVKKERIRSHSLPRAGFFLANPRPISIFTSAFLFKVKTGTYWN